MSVISNKKLFLFDIDGTLAVGDELLDGSRELLELIEKKGGKSFFITNNSTKSAADYVVRFKEVFGLETQEWQFLTSGQLTLKHLQENYADKKIYVQATKSYVNQLTENGLNITEKYEEDIACILVAYDSEVTYEKLCETSLALQSTLEDRVPFLATNPDLRCPAPFGFIPDCGAICDMLTSTTDRKPTYLGKPARRMVDEAVAFSGMQPEEVLVVGDRLYTDIACGIAARVDTALVLTGEAKREDLKDTEYPPTIVYENVRKLLESYQ